MIEERVQISTEEAKSKEKQHDLKTKVTSKHGNFTLDEQAAIQKNIKSCKDQSLVANMDKGNYLQIQGAGKQNCNRHVQPAVRKDAQKA